MQADTFTSSSFQVLDPVIDIGGGYATSTSFSLKQVFGQFILGTSTASSFQIESGFLAYPEATSPAVSATPGAAKVDLSWTASQAFVGWTVTAYELGTATSSGGPYTFEDVGSVLSFSKTGLSAGTMYYFVVRTEDAFGNYIATSTEVSATPTEVVEEEEAVVSRGGGGPIIQPPNTSIWIKGKGYPLNPVLLLKDGRIMSTAFANVFGDFKINLRGLVPGEYNFSVYGKDYDGRKSKTTSIVSIIEADKPVEVDGVFISPTINTDKSKVKLGELVTFFGQSLPNTDVIISINYGEFFAKVKTNKEGKYSFKFDSSKLDIGFYSAKAMFRIPEENLTSEFGYSVNFEVGTKNILREEDVECPLYGDLNSECRVDLVDFSILLYWFNKTDFPKRIDINKDGIINMYDFSIMAYYWTG